MIYAAGAVVLIYMFLVAFVVCWEIRDGEFRLEEENEDDEKQES